MFLCRPVNKITTHVRLNQCNIKTKKPLFFQSLIKETYIQQPAVRAFNVIQNPYCNSKWSKLLNTNGWPARIKESRGFRQKPDRSLGQKFGPFVNEKEILDSGEVHAKRVTWKKLIRPLIFTLTFSTSSICCAAIWQYENMRKVYSSKESYRKLERQIFEDWFDVDVKRGQFRPFLNEWWNKLDTGDKLFVPILALNVVVFAMWRAPVLRSVMYKYFTSNLQLSNKGMPMLLSAFSHQSLVHLGCNMFVLHSFAGPIVSLLGKEQFLGLYLSSCVITSFFSHASKIATGIKGSSLGASGAICTVLGVFGTLMPDARLEIIFLPFISFSAAVGIKALLAMDTVGLLARWKLFDHAAHLSGMLFGLWWCYQGHDIIWSKREYVMNKWHNMRENIQK